MLEVFITNLANKEHNKIQQTKAVVRERQRQRRREKEMAKDRLREREPRDAWMVHSLFQSHAWISAEYASED